MRKIEIDLFWPSIAAMVVATMALGYGWLRFGSAMTEALMVALAILSGGGLVQLLWSRLHRYTLRRRTRREVAKLFASFHRRKS